MTSHFSENHDEKQIAENNCKEDVSEQHVTYRWTLADAVGDLTLPVRHSSRIVVCKILVIFCLFICLITYKYMHLIIKFSSLRCLLHLQISHSVNTVKLYFVASFFSTLAYQLAKN
jgi:hypothetical protein